MNKHVILASLIFISGFRATAQKYALIDQTLSHPVRYSNTISTQDIQQKLIPIEAKYLPQFLKALETIKHELDQNNPHAKARNFHFGCISISGMVAPLAKETRFNYVIKSDCEAVNTSFLICDVKFKNATNSFIIGTWIKYLKANLKKKT